MPHGDGQLARDNGGAQPDAVLDHLEEVGRLVGGEGPQQEVIDLLRYLDKSIYPEAGIIPISRRGRSWNSWWN